MKKTNQQLTRVSSSVNTVTWQVLEYMEAELFS